MAISTNGAVIVRLAGGLYNTVISNGTYSDVSSLDPSALANTLYARDFASKTDLAVATTLVTNLGLSSVAGLANWVAAQLTAAGSTNKGAKVVDLLNSFANMTSDATYGAFATAFNAKVDAALASSQKVGSAEGVFATAGVVTPVTSFALTTGVDTIVGSSGDDTITAPNTVAATGAAQTTINAGDSVDGGLGNDTLTMTFGGLNNNQNLVSIKGVENIIYVGVDNLASGADAVATATAAAATRATALTVAANQVAAATTNAALAVTAATAANTANTAAAAKQAGLVALNTAIGALTNAGTLEADIAALTAVAVTNTFLSATEKAVVDAPVGITATQAALLPYTTAATTAATAASAAKSLADAQSAAAAAVVTAYGVTNPVTAAAAADATAKADLAAAKLALGSVTIAANADATSITIDGTKTTVSGLTDVQTVTSSGTGVANSFATSSSATKVNLNLSSSGGTYTFLGGANATTANVTGSTKQGTAGSTTGSAPGSITLVDQVLGTPTSDTIKTLNLSLTSNTTVATAELTALTSINGSGSTGGLGLTPAASVLNVTTGTGADSVTFIAATDITSTSKATSSLSTGAGNDTIIVNVSGTGSSTVNAGAGDDTVTLTSGIGSALIDGGDGKDTLVVANATFTAGQYNSLKANVSNFEVLSLSATSTVDASKASQFSEFTFAGAGSSITKVADTQSVNVAASSSVAAAGYLAKGALDANGDAALTTTYAGTLTVKASGANVVVTPSTNALNLTVSTTPTVLNGVTSSAASNVLLTGDVKTATVTLNNSVNNSKLPTADVATSITLSPDSTTVGGTGQFTNLGNLTALTLTGTGSATVNNSGTGSKLASIDASGLSGKVTIAGSTLGNATAGLSWTAGTLAETVKLGSALDTLTIAAANSTYAKIDSITGFSLVADAAGNLVASKSDNITGGVTGTYVAKTTGVTGTLDAALIAAGNHTVSGAASENVVFQNGGNTYIYRDVGSDGLTDNDVVIELVGLVDLTLLIADLAA